jgi:hypothetical protein
LLAPISNGRESRGEKKTIYFNIIKYLNACNGCDNPTELNEQKESYTSEELSPVSDSRSRYCGH